MTAEKEKVKVDDFYDYAVRSIEQNKAVCQVLRKNLDNKLTTFEALEKIFDIFR